MRILPVVVLVAAAAAGCSKAAPSNEPGAVAERFLDLYLLEVDQERALPLTTGVAHKRLEDELADVASVRATGYTAGVAKSQIYYDRVMLREDAASDRARAVYDLTIKHPHGETKRHVLLTLTNRDAGQWKVASFTFVDGPARRR